MPIARRHSYTLDGLDTSAGKADFVASHAGSAFVAGFIPSTLPAMNPDTAEPCATSVQR